jgi:hypothetical protein
VKPALVLSLSLTLAACGGQSPAPEPKAAPAASNTTAPPPAPPSVAEILATIAIPDQPAPEPAAVQATISVDDARTLYGSLLAYAELVQPGASQGMSWDAVVALAQQQGVDLGGGDLSQPLWVVTLDDAVASPPVLIVTRVADEAALRRSLDSSGREVIIRDGWAAIGTLAALKASAPWALSTLIHETPEAGLVIDLRGATLAGELWPWLDRIIDNGVDALEREGTDPLPDIVRQLGAVAEALLTQSLHGRLHLRFLETVMELELVVEPAQDTALADLVADHAPATFEVMSAFRDDPVIVGLRLDPTRFSGEVQLFLVPFATLTEERERWIGAWTELSAGEQAIALYDASGFNLRWEYAVSDAARARRLRKEQSQAKDYQVGAARHRGVSLDREVMNDLDVQVWNAGSKGRFTFAMGSEAQPRVRARIDALRSGEPPAPDWLAAAQARATERKEQVLAVVDLAAILQHYGAASPGDLGDARVELGLRLSAQQSRLRLRVPADQYRALVVAAPLFQ